MDKKEIEKKIVDYVKETAAIEEGFNLTNDTLLFDEGLFDSMGFMTLVSFLQEEFGFEFGDEDLVIENFESIDAIVNNILKKSK